MANVPKSLGGCPADAFITSSDEEIGLNVREDEALHSHTDCHHHGAGPPLKAGAGDAGNRIMNVEMCWSKT